MPYFRKRNGTWEYRISYKAPDGSFKQKSKSGFRTKSEAQAAASEAERKVTGRLAVNDDITFSDYLRTWADTYKKTSLRKGTWRNYQQTFKIVDTYLGNIQLKKISPSIYQGFLNTLGKVYYYGTIRVHHHRLRSCVKYAIADGIIDRNFTDLAIISTENKSKPLSEKYLELADYHSLLSKLEDNITTNRYLQLYLIAVTGMRVSESLGLTWEDIDFENAQIDINKTWDIYDQEGFVPTKNPQSIRIVPAPEKLLNFLRDYKTSHWQKNSLNRIFLEPNQVWLNIVIKKLSGQNIHVHSLRHTYASYLITQGVELLSVSRILGHKDLTVTLQTYTHLLEDKQTKDFQTVRNLFE